MRSVWLTLLLATGCVPSFDAVPCYGAGECPAPAVCVHRRCLTPPVDMAVDMPVPDAGVVDRLEAVARFGKGGLADVPVSDVRVVTSVRRLSDGGLLIGGRVAGGSLPDGETMFVARVTAAGTLDPDFANGGLFQQRAPAIDRLRDLRPLPDGGFLLLGSSTSDGRSTLTMQRMTGAGVLDLTFGDAGKVQLRDELFVGADSSGVLSVLTPAGRIRIVGIAHEQYPGGHLAWTAMIAQLDSNGQLDSLFGDAGVSVQPRRDQVQLTPAFAQFDDDGALLVGGSCSGEAICSARVLADGTFDRTYGVDGVAVAAVEDTQGRYFVADGARDSVGLVVVGYENRTEGAVIRLTRLEADGDVDRLFGDAGQASLGAPAMSRGSRLQAHCGGVELGIGDGRVWRFDADGVRTATLDTIAPLTLKNPTIFALGDGEWATLAARETGLDVMRFATTCLTQGN